MRSTKSREIPCLFAAAASCCAHGCRCSALIRAFMSAVLSSPTSSTGPFASGSSSSSAKASAPTTSGTLFSPPASPDFLASSSIFLATSFAFLAASFTFWAACASHWSRHWHTLKRMARYTTESRGMQVTLHQNRSNSISMRVRRSHTPAST